MRRRRRALYGPLVGSGGPRRDPDAMCRLRARSAPTTRHPPGRWAPVPFLVSTFASVRRATVGDAVKPRAAARSGDRPGVEERRGVGPVEWAGESDAGLTGPGAAGLMSASPGDELRRCRPDRATEQPPPTTYRLSAAINGPGPAPRRRCGQPPVSKPQDSAATLIVRRTLSQVHEIVPHLGTATASIPSPAARGRSPGLLHSGGHEIVQAPGAAAHPPPRAPAGAAGRRALIPRAIARPEQGQQFMGDGQPHRSAATLQFDARDIFTGQ